MNTDLIAAYYELEDTYEAVDLSRLCDNPYFYDQTILCYALTTATVTWSAPFSTTTSVNIEPPVVIPIAASTPTTTGLDLLSSVSASSAPTAIPEGNFLDMPLEEYCPMPPAVHCKLLAKLPAEEASNIILQTEIFEQMLNSGMTAAGLRVLKERLEEQYVAAALKQREKA